MTTTEDRTCCQPDDAIKGTALEAPVALLWMQAFAKGLVEAAADVKEAVEQLGWECAAACAWSHRNIPGADTDPEILGELRSLYYELYHSQETTQGWARRLRDLRIALGQDCVLLSQYEEKLAKDAARGWIDDEPVPNVVRRYAAQRDATDKGEVSS